MHCTDDADSMPFRVLPDTCVELFVNYTGKHLATIKGAVDSGEKGSFFSFRLSGFMDVQMQPGSGCIAVCFYPGAACHFFKTPMAAFTDSATELNLAWGNIAAELEERVALCASETQRAELIQHYLLRQLVKNHKTDAAVQYCLSEMHTGLSVNELAEKTGISQRQLSRRFQKNIGLGPKEFSRVNRFLRALDYMKKNNGNSLTDVAYACGYYDQSHFIFDFKAFAGITPGELYTAGRVIF